MPTVSESVAGSPTKLGVIELLAEPVVKGTVVGYITYSDTSSDTLSPFLTKSIDTDKNVLVLVGMEIIGIDRVMRLVVVRGVNEMIVGAWE